MNNVLLNHNVDKQMSDSRGDVAYMMADISNVGKDGIKEIYTSLEELARKLFLTMASMGMRVLTVHSEDTDEGPLLTLGAV